MPTAGTPEDLRRWVQNQRAAQDREREAARESGYATDPVRAAFDLIDLAAEHLGWPIPEDEVRRRETEHAREQWARLRKALGGP